MDVLFVSFFKTGGHTMALLVKIRDGELHVKCIGSRPEVAFSYVADGIRVFATGEPVVSLDFSGSVENTNLHFLHPGAPRTFREDSTFLALTTSDGRRPKRRLYEALNAWRP